MKVDYLLTGHFLNDKVILLLSSQLFHPRGPVLEPNINACIFAIFVEGESLWDQKKTSLTS